MKLTEIILSKYAPQNLRAVWLHPSDTGIEVFIYNNGKWEEISVLDKSGDSVTIGSKDSEFTIIAKDSKVHIQDQNGNIHQVITTETSVGQKTSEGGEIFNDYKNNVAGASYAHAEGQKTIASGNSSHAEGVGTKATNANSHSEGNQTTASGSSSHSEGYSTTASGGYSHAEGNKSQATASAAHAEGTNTVASAPNAHAEGQNNTADAAQAHAEGGNNIAHGQNSHAEGNGNTANGGSSHVEGYDNTAEGSYCHVEGGHNTASGSGSHAEGIGTQATNEGEHAEGRYNISNNGGTNASRTVHSVGVGTSSTKRNAHEIMWNGDHYIYGLGGYNGTNYADAQTLQEVIDEKQDKTDTSLTTESKTIIGAINELEDTKEDTIDIIWNKDAEGTESAGFLSQFLTKAKSKSIGIRIVNDPFSGPVLVEDYFGLGITPVKTGNVRSIRLDYWEFDYSDNTTNHMESLEINLSNDSKWSSKLIPTTAQIDNHLEENYQPIITPGTGLAFDGNTLNVTLDLTSLQESITSLTERVTALETKMAALESASTTETLE